MGGGDHLRIGVGIGVGRQRRVHPRQGRHQAIGGAVEQVGERAIGLVGEALTQESDPDAWSQGSRAAGGLLFAGDDPQQGRFSGAVRPDQANAFAAIDDEGNGVENGVVAVANGDVGDG